MILWAIFWNVLIISVILMLIISLFIPKKFYNPLVILVCKIVMYSLLLFPRNKGLKKEEVPFPVIYVANHVSFFDIFICGSILPGNPRGLELKSHFNKPIYGWFISRFGEIPIDTSSKSSIKHSFLQITEMLKNKVRSILIMPEGTRTRNGKIGAFKSGAFYLSRLSGIPIVPVVYKGLFERNNPTNIIVNPGFFDVIILPPVNPADFSSDDEMANFVRNLMSKTLEEKQ